MMNQNKNFKIKQFPREEPFFGISLPDQALVKSDYLPKGDLLNLNQIECPIIYHLDQVYY